MAAEDVMGVVSAIRQAGISVWLDGGWGVDALIGEQTRPHDDLDVVIPLLDAERSIGALAALGYEVEIDARPTRLVLANGKGQRIDIHLVALEPNGNARQIGAGPGGGDAVYPSGGFLGSGKIAGEQVDCLTPHLLVAHHMGYEPQDKDRHNVRLLCERFGIPLPAAYR